MKIKLQRWPWHKGYGWGKCGLMGRFGGGWKTKLGIMIGGKTIILDLLFGSVRIEWGKREK